MVRIAARGSKEIEILVGASGPGAAYAILAPDGLEICSGEIAQADWVAVSFPVTANGTYRLQLQANSQPGAEHGLRMRAEVVALPASSNDKIKQAEALYSSAEVLRNSLQAADVREAILKYQQAATLWVSAGGRDSLLLARSGEARAWLALSQYRNGIAVLDRAIDSLDTGSEFFRASLLTLKAEEFLVAWDSRSASPLAAQALRIARALNDPELQARALYCQGASEYWIHAPAAAADLDDALGLAYAASNFETIGEVQRFKAWAEEDQGHLTRALALMQQAQEAFQRAGNRREVLHTMPYFADIENHEGDHYSALLANARLLSPVMASGNIENYGNVLGNMGGYYAALNRNRDAITYFEKAVAAYVSIHHDAGESIYRGNLCLAELRLKQLDNALRECEKSAALAETAHDPKRLAITTWRLGKVRQAMGHNQLAVDQYRQAAELSARVPDPHFESEALIDWGDAIESAGRREEALPLFKKAFELSEQAEDQSVQLEARFRIARWYANAGEAEDAIRELKIALDKIEAQRTAVQNGDLRASYLAAVRKCHQLYVEILMRDHLAHPSRASDIAALEINESSLARSLLDALAERGPTKSRAESGDAAADRIKLRTAVDQAYDRRLKLMLEGGHTKELEENSAALTQTIDSLQRLDDAERDSAGRGSPTGRPLTAEEIAEASKSAPGTLFEYELGAAQSYLWIVSDGTIRSHVIHARQDEIETLVRKWRSLAAAGAPREGADAELARLSAQLSCKLVAPFLEPRMERLSIVPDGDLALMPFALLPTSGCNGDPGPPLITDHRVTMIPSLSIFLSKRNPEERRTFSKEVAVLADPVFDVDDVRVHPASSDLQSSQPPAAVGENKRQGPALPRLPGTAEEAAGIAEVVGPGKVSLFLGFKAGIDTILSPAMRDYRIIHLATHGVLDTSAPGLSGLVLSLVSPDGRPVAGFLKIDDIASLRIPAELVVLSSCDSGAGDTLGGEGVTGLSHAFLEAGARQLVSTLWSVDDTTTRQLMVDFYREMFRNGADPEEALRRSQLKMMARPRRSAPYFWAGFVITSAAN